MIVNDKDKLIDLENLYNEDDFLKSIEYLIDAALIEPVDQNITDPFKNRCLLAASNAYKIACLRKKKHEIGFISLPLKEYLSKIAENQGIILSEFFEYNDTNKINDITEDSIYSICTFAQKIGLTLKEILIHIRLSYASLMGAFPFRPDNVRARENVPTMNKLDIAEMNLEQIESNYNLNDTKNLRKLLNKIKKIYKTEAR